MESEIKRVTSSKAVTIPLVYFDRRVLVREIKANRPKGLRLLLLKIIKGEKYIQRLSKVMAMRRSLKRISYLEKVIRDTKKSMQKRLSLQMYKGVFDE